MAALYNYACVRGMRDLPTLERIVWLLVGVKGFGGLLGFPSEFE